MKRIAHAVMFGLGVALSLALSPAEAAAGGAWITDSGATVVEERLALAYAPARTTIWTSLRFEHATGGVVALILPVPEGTMADFVGDAWLEALERSTSPHLFPPHGETPYCDGESGNDAPFTQDLVFPHAVGLEPGSAEVLPDPAAVSAWVGEHGLVLSPGLAGTIAQMAGQRFIAVAFAAPSGQSVTRTLRAVLPQASATLPLSLVEAGPGPRLVAAYLLGAGRPAYGGAPLEVPRPGATWLALPGSPDGSNTYEDARTKALAASASSAFIAESAGHGALVTGVDWPHGGGHVDSAFVTYTTLARQYGEVSADVATCLTTMGTALAATTAVAPACPPAVVAVGAVSCDEAPAGGEVDPDTLRCGELDDLALALATMTPASTWLTRHLLRIPASQSGADYPVTLGASGSAEPVDPVIVATSVDRSACSDVPVSGPSGGGVVGGGDDESCTCIGVQAAAAPVVAEPSSSGTGGNGGAGVGGASGTTSGEPEPEADTTSDDGCGCGDGPGTETEESDEGCGCDDSGPGSGSKRDEGDSGSDSGSSGASDSGCDCGGSQDDGGGCDCGGTNCSVRERKKGPKFSMLLFVGALCLSALRRRGSTRRRRRGEGGSL